MMTYLICIPLLFIALLPLLNKQVRHTIGDILTSEDDEAKRQKGPG